MAALASQITSLTIVYSTVYSGADQIKHQSSASLAFVRGIHRWPVNSTHKGPVTRNMFPFDDVIMSDSLVNVPQYAQTGQISAWWPWHWQCSPVRAMSHVTLLRGSIFHITSHFWGESIGHQCIFPHKYPAMRNFDVFVVVSVNMLLIKQSFRWFEMRPRGAYIRQ